MYQLTGGCHCGNIHISVDFSHAPGEYTPRACDCDFCRQHGASYISDPNGAVRLKVKNPALLGKYRQGSAMADFLFCLQCGVLVSVIYQENAHLYATVNRSALSNRDDFGATQSVSPKRLSATEKMTRWKQLWFSHVSITSDEN